MMPTDVEIVDLMIGFPSEDPRRKYESLRELAKTRPARKLNFPAEYMFKDVPDQLVSGQDPVDVTLAAMDRHGISIGLVGLGNTSTADALARHPDRFAASLEVDPNNIGTSVNAIRRAHADISIAAVSTFPAGCNPQVPVNDRRYYPIYQTCVDLDIPIMVNAGIAGPRVPSECQHVMLFRSGLLRLPQTAGRHAPRRRALGGPGRQVDAQVARAPLHDVGLRAQVLPEGDRGVRRRHSRRGEGDVRRLLPDGAEPGSDLRRAARGPVP